MESITLINFNKDTCLVLKNDIIRIDANGKSVFVTGANLINTLVSSESWNSLCLDSKHGTKHTICELLGLRTDVNYGD